MKARLSPLALIALLLLSACSSQPPAPPRKAPPPKPVYTQAPTDAQGINTQYHARAQDSRVQYVVVHYTAADLDRSLMLLTERDVSSHYLIGAQPATVYRLVTEDRRAWHAGKSYWKGRDSLNATTIGIELVNPGFTENADGTRTWYPFPDGQIDALIVLLKDIVQRHNLPIDSVVGHNEIAPQRKSDPGPLFPWKRLADAGLIRWPDPTLVARYEAQYRQRMPGVLWFQERLAQHGYEVPHSGVLDKQTQQVISVFQGKYRPANYSGVPDAETAAILQALVQQ